MGLAGIFTGIFLILAVYCAVDPFNHSAIHEFPDFKAFKVETPPWSELPIDRDRENLLQRSTIMFSGQVQGPESLAFDPSGRGPYTGLADGRVIFWDGTQWKDFAYTSANRSGLCGPKPSILSYAKYEHVCGRPLGLRFDKKSGELYIADAYLGILKVGPKGGLATSLATEAEGVPLGFTNDLDVDDEGNVYFTDSSVNYQRRNFLQLIFSGDDSGRLLKYDPKTKETVVLVRNIQFPNGVSLSKDGSFLVFCEGALGRLSKYWLKGEKSGTHEVMANLPGHPDNVRTNERGEFWVALHCRRSLYSYLSGMFPSVRKLLLKLPISARAHYLMQIGGHMHAIVVKYSVEGKLLKVLEDRDGKVVRAASEVEERDGKLWIGSVLMSFVAVYSLE